MNGKASRSQNGDSLSALAPRSSKKSDTVSPALMDSRMIPTNASAMPTEQMNTYFQVASRAALFPS